MRVGDFGLLVVARKFFREKKPIFCLTEGEENMFRIRTVAAVAAIALGTLVGMADNSFARNPCCCCPPAPIQTTLCVQAPCSCCVQNVCVCVPGCCTEAPTVCWRSGLFGRQIATYTWPCCGHSVKVVVTRRGDVKVRG